MFKSLAFITSSDLELTLVFLNNFDKCVFGNRELVLTQFWE